MKLIFVCSASQKAFWHYLGIILITLGWQPSRELLESWHQLFIAAGNKSSKTDTTMYRTFIMGNPNTMFLLCIVFSTSCGWPWKSTFLNALSRGGSICLLKVMVVNCDGSSGEQKDESATAWMPFQKGAALHSILLEHWIAICLCGNILQCLDIWVCLQKGHTC